MLRNPNTTSRNHYFGAARWVYGSDDRSLTENASFHDLRAGYGRDPDSAVVDGRLLPSAKWGSGMDWRHDLRDWSRHLFPLCVGVCSERPRHARADRADKIPGHHGAASPRA